MTNLKIISETHVLLQKKIRNHLQQKLARHHGRIAQSELDSLLSDPALAKTFTKRFMLKVAGSDFFEWKPEITSWDIVMKKGLPKALLENQKLKMAFEDSKKIPKRTQYSFLAPANHSTQLQPMTLTHDPVFGFDILVLPFNEVTDVQPESEPISEKRNLNIGKLSFACCLHFSDLQKEGLELRLVWGEYFLEKNLGHHLLDTFKLLEFKVLDLLKKNEVEKAVSLILEKAHTAVGYMIANSF